MNVRAQTIAIIASVSLCLIAGLGLVSQGAILDGFANLEETHIEETLDRVVRTIDLRQEYLAGYALYLGQCDGISLTMAGEQTEYPEIYSDTGLYEYLDIQYIIFTREDGSILSAEGYDPRDERPLPIPLELSLLHHDLMAEGFHETSGFLKTGEGPVFVVLAPIEATSGAVSFGQLVDDEWIAALSKETGEDLTITLDGNPERVASVFRSADGTMITGSRLLSDIHGSPLFLLSVTHDRSIYEKGRLAYQSAFIVIAFLAFISGVLIYLFLNHSFISRIASLNSQVQKIKGDSVARDSVYLEGDDELSGLAGSINGMLESLDQHQGRIRESEERYRRIFNAAMDPMLLVAIDPDDNPGVICDANEAALSLLGVGYHDLIGMRLSKFFDMEHANPETGLSIGHFHPVSGESIPVEVSMHTFSMNHQPAAVWVARNISERLRVEEERNLSLEQISHNIEQFAIIGDSIRNPLQVIRGYLLLLKDKPEYIPAIDEEIDQIDGQIMQLDERWLESENVIRFLKRNNR